MSDEELTQLLAVSLLLQLVERLQDVALHSQCGPRLQEKIASDEVRVSCIGTDLQSWWSTSRVPRFLGSRRVGRGV
jgi:hypothetical protein